MLKSAALLLLLLGDLNFTGLQYMTAFQKAGYDPAFSFQNAAPIIQTADIAVANLEGPLTFAEWAKESEQNHWRFRQLPVFAKGIKDAGINILLLGNNHIADAGTQGIEDTLVVLKEEGLKWVPAPRDGPLVVRRNGVVVDLWNADVFSVKGSHPWAVSGEELAKLILERSKGKPKPDIAIAFVHAHFSDRRQADDLSARLRRAGINWVILGGVHTPGGMNADPLGGVHYGLGDFIFGCECSGSTKGKAFALKVKGGVLETQEMNLELGSSSNGFVTRFQKSGVVSDRNAFHLDQ